MIERRWTAAFLMALGVLLALEVAALALTFAFPPGMARLQHASAVVLDRHGAWLRALPTQEGRWRLAANLDGVDPVFLHRLIALEDARFYLHPGVDPLATFRAAAADMAAGRVRSGGSTLTMQLARRLDPRPRTGFAKLMEAVRALQLDALLGKRQVLADYLTLTPYGGNLEGVRAASLAWFGHEPDHLSDAEQALLIALPQAPEARRPDRHPSVARAARSRILGKLERAGLINLAARTAAEAAALPHRTPMPALAWLAADQIAHQTKTARSDVRTTLDAPLQARVEAMARQVARAQGPASSAAILVVEAKSRAVRAAVGSAGLDLPGGWVDETRAFRSPGSTLKPFIYGMAFESGVAAPDTRVADAPVTYGAYRPQDFDRAFHGEVTVGQALQMSLNVPAVEVLSAIGPSAFEERLRAVGVDWRRSKSNLAGPSLALALGGEGVRLQDVAMLYAALADEGMAKPLAWTETDAIARSKSSGLRLLRADAALQVLDILSHTPPPTGRASALIGLGPKLSFKTGTSYGFRDAVAAGVGGGYVVVVWTGRADGGARPGMTGRQAALPLMFDVFDLLQSGSGLAAPELLHDAPQSLQQLADQDEDPPRLQFPPDGARLQLGALGPRSPGLALTAQGRKVRWYVDGAPIPSDQTTGQTLWRPDFPGFYAIAAVGLNGKRTEAHVRVLR